MKKVFKALSLCLVLTLVLAFCGVYGCKKQNPRSEYDITATLEGNRITATQTFTFYNGYENSFKKLKFNLYANAFRKDAKISPILAQHLSASYPNGINYGDMIITKCTQESKPIEFVCTGEDQNILEVTLNREVFPNERAIIVIEYQINLANVVARTGVNDHTINLANFYPVLCAYDQNGFYECAYYGIGDPFYSECSDYKIRFICDQKYTIASSGNVTYSATENGQKTTIFKIDNARSFAMVLSSKFQMISRDINGVKLQYFYYQDDTPQTSINYAVQAIKYFQKTFGEYPYPTYSVVQTPFVQGGMEFPAMVMISDNLEPNAYGEVIVHETAHQWWQTVVGNNEIEYGFLDEGLAEYSVVMFYENHPEYGMTRKNMVASAEQTYKIFCSVWDKINKKTDTKMIKSLKDFSSEYEYVNIAYIKPCIMYDLLRTTIGEERFFSGLKTYYTNYAFKNATPHDLAGVFEKKGADTNGFFEGFFNGSAII